MTDVSLEPMTGLEGPVISAIADEERLLGALLAEETGASVALVAEIIETPEFFVRPAHQAIWIAVQALARRGDPCSATAIPPAVQKLPRRYRAANVDGLRVAEILRAGAIPEQVKYHADRVAAVARRRMARDEFVTAIADLNRPDTDADKVIARVLERVAPTELRDLTTPHLPGLPTYPDCDLIGPLADLVRTGAEAGLPKSYLGGAGLHALATVTGSAQLKLSDTRIVRPVLWVPLIGPAGSAKTPSINTARKTLRELDSKTAVDFIADFELWAEKKPNDRGEKPKDDRRLVDDATLEAVAIRMAEGDSILGVDADELTEWLSGLSRYRSGGGSDRARWLSLWSSQPWTVDRAGGRRLHIARPVISVCGGIQPHLTSLLGPEGDGMRPRWLPHPSNDLEVTWRPGEIAPLWATTITQLYRARKERTWSLSDPAMSAWTSATVGWKKITRKAEAPPVIAAAAKADEQAARIALVLAESQAPDTVDGLIDEDTMGCAIVLVDYFLDVWRSMPGGHTSMALSRRDEVLDAGVDELAIWLERREDGRAPRRDIQRGRVAGARTPEDVAALMHRYEAVYPGSVRSERTGLRGPMSEVVYAPRRGSSKTVTGDSFGEST